MPSTRWSAYDLLGRMEAEHGEDKRYCFIAIPVWDENEISNFEYDHPDCYTTEKTRDIKNTIDSADFECLFMQHGVEKEGLAFASDKLKYYNGVLPDGDPDNIVFVNDVAWGGGDSLSMPIAYVYGTDVFGHDWVFDKRDKSFTKPRVIAKIVQHKIKMGKTEANSGGEEYSDDVYRILRQDYSYSINMSHKKAPTNMGKLTRIEQHSPTIRSFHFRESSCRDEDYRKDMNELTSFSFAAKTSTMPPRITWPCLLHMCLTGASWPPWRRGGFENKTRQNDSFAAAGKMKVDTHKMSVYFWETRKNIICILSVRLLLCSVHLWSQYHHD